MTLHLTRRPGPGFTLVELLVALAISPIVIAGGIALLGSQERIFRSSTGARQLQEVARVALGELSFGLRRAGYGVDPGFALDFGPTQALQYQAPLNTTELNRNVQTQSYRCNAPVVCRDSIQGPDEIVWYARDPLFGHPLAQVGGANSITLGGPVNFPLEQGQVLLLICMQDPMYWVYVTVGAHVDPNPVGDVIVPLRPSPAFAFPQENTGAVNPAVPTACFTNGTARVAKVDRFRYHIQNYDPAGNPVGPLDNGARPFLMLDQGLVDQGGNLVETVVAPDIEDLQFAYIFPQQIPAESLVGAAPNTPIANSPGPEGIDLGAASSGFFIEQGDARRRTWHPSNIRAVRISVVVRTPVANPRIPDATVPAAGNRPDIAGPAGFQRLRFETTVQVPNVDARRPYFPFLTQNPGDQLNTGGS
jgi:type IV pilus assembly protein PilW